MHRVLFAVLMAAPFIAHAQGAQALLESKGCLGCHAVDQRVVGPAFREVAAKYKGQKGAEAKIAGELKKGEGHPMKIDATDAALKTLAQFVLAEAGAATAKAAAGAPLALYDSNGCFGCHAFDKRVVGPAFNDIAAKFRGDKGAEAALFGMLREGKGHPVKVEAPESNLRAMICGILGAGRAKPATAAQPSAPPPLLQQPLRCRRRTS